MGNLDIGKQNPSAWLIPNYSTCITVLDLYPKEYVRKRLPTEGWGAQMGYHRNYALQRHARTHVSGSQIIPGI